MSFHTRFLLIAAAELGSARRRRVVAGGDVILLPKIWSSIISLQLVSSHLRSIALQLQQDTAKQLTLLAIKATMITIWGCITVQHNNNNKNISLEYEYSMKQIKLNRKSLSDLFVYLIANHHLSLTFQLLCRRQGIAHLHLLCMANRVHIIGYGSNYWTVMRIVTNRSWICSSESVSCQKADKRQHANVKQALPPAESVRHNSSSFDRPLQQLLAGSPRRRPPVYKPVNIGNYQLPTNCFVRQVRDEELRVTSTLCLFVICRRWH